MKEDNKEEDGDCGICRLGEQYCTQKSVPPSRVSFDGETFMPPPPPPLGHASHAFGSCFCATVLSPSFSPRRKPAKRENEVLSSLRKCGFPISKDYLKNRFSPPPVNYCWSSVPIPASRTIIPFISRTGKGAN